MEIIEPIILSFIFFSKSPMPKSEEKEVKIVKIENKKDTPDILIIKKEGKKIEEEVNFYMGNYDCCSCCAEERSEYEFLSDPSDSSFEDFPSQSDDYINSVEENFAPSNFSDEIAPSFSDDVDFENVFVLPSGLTNDEINKLNRITYSNIFTNIKQCSICYSDFLPSDVVLELRCNHIYHCNCIIQWLINNGDCPYCKDVVKK